MTVLQEVAWGNVRSDGVLLNGRGASVSRVGAGVYEIALSDDFLLDSDEMMLTVTPINSNEFVGQSGGGTDAVKTIRTFSGGVATDTDFYFKIERLNIL